MKNYTAPAHLGIQGGGAAGGILISNSITTRPDLFGAAQIAARLQTATASGKPVLLRVDYAAVSGSVINQNAAQRRNR